MAALDELLLVLLSVIKINVIYTNYLHVESYLVNVNSNKF